MNLEVEIYLELPEGPRQEDPQLCLICTIFR